MEKVERFWLLRRKPLILMALTAIAVMFFTLVVFLSRSYQRQQEKLGRDLSNRGTEEFKLQHFDTAALDYRAALHYSRNNPIYQLHLAQALAAVDRTDEAYSYLQNLLERQPNEGAVNLELARVEARRGKSDQAIRYYHNAIYSTWNADPEANRRKAWLELIRFLLDHESKVQAKAELIALTSTLPNDPRSDGEIADLYLRSEDYEHALERYQNILKTSPQNEEALMGAGRSAFELSRYSVAQHYLEETLKLNPQNAQASGLLPLALLTTKSDPFARRLSDTQRSQRVLRAFEVAGNRIKSCTDVEGDLKNLATRWAEFKPKMKIAALRGEPQLRDNAMDLVGAIEQQTEHACGAASADDTVLLLIARDRERTER